MSEQNSRAAKRAATAQRILEAARAEFGEHGLEAATIRGIARRAKVDPSLVMQHYGSKAALFNSAIQLGEAGSGEIEAHLHDVLDVRLAALPPETRALVRSMLTSPEAAAQVSAFLNERAANLSRAMSGDDADLRAALTVSSILGLIIARHFLQLDAFARASDAEIARVAGPWVTTGADPATGQHSRASAPADCSRNSATVPAVVVRGQPRRGPAAADSPSSCGSDCIPLVPLPRGGPTASPDQQEGAAQRDQRQDEQDSGVDVAAGVGRAGRGTGSVRPGEVGRA